MCHCHVSWEVGLLLGLHGFGSPRLGAASEKLMPPKWEEEVGELVRSLEPGVPFCHSGPGGPPRFTYLSCLSLITL